MFTGIIVDIGTIKTLIPKDRDVSLQIALSKINLGPIGDGDSIAINGVCLTVTEKKGHCLWFDVSAETLANTTFKQLKVGDKVNIETAMTAATAFGGHIVSGHIDGVGKVLQRCIDGRSERFEISAAKDIMKFIAKKGSICVDGVSLTVNEVNNNSFSVNIIPFTMQETVFKDYCEGSTVNLEVDTIARYVDRLLEMKNSV